MMNNKSQEQIVGANSINLQAGKNLTINNGLTVSEIKELIKTESKSELIRLFLNNFPLLQNIAKVEANKRAEELVNKFNDKLLNQEEKVIKKIYERLALPDMQVSFFEAQKNYAKSGDKDKADLLSDLLINKGKEEHESLKDFLIDEAIEKLSKLTKQQINLLSLLVAKSLISNNVNNFESLRQYIISNILLYKDCLPISDQNLEYLVQVNCLTTKDFINPISIEGEIIKNYKGLFAKGFSREEIEKEINFKKYPQLITNCLSNYNLLQINALNDLQLNNFFSENGVEENIQVVIKKYFDMLLPNNQILEKIMKIAPEIEFIILNSKNLNKCHLAPLGIMIGISNIKNMINEHIDWDFN